MQVRVRDILASCPCGSTDFVAPRAARYKANDVFTCAKCGRKRIYAELLDRIGEEAMRRARASLDSMRSRKPRRRRGGAPP